MIGHNSSLYPPSLFLDLSLSRPRPAADHACEHFIMLWGVVLLSADIDLTVTEGLFKGSLWLQSPWVTISLFFCLRLQMHPSLTFTTSTVTSKVWRSVGIKQIQTALLLPNACLCQNVKLLCASVQLTLIVS